MKHTLIALLEDRPGAMSRVLGLLRGRGLVLYGITAGESENPGIKRITVVVETDNVDQTIKQLNRLIEVLEVTDVTNSQYVVRETALVKIHAAQLNVDEIRSEAESIGARIIMLDQQNVVVEMTDTPDRLGEMIARARVLGACETMRSGSLAMSLGTPAPRDQPVVPEESGRPWWQADGAC